MPELPEVERGRRIAEEAARGRRVEKVWCDDDRIVFHRVSPAKVRRALVGARVLEVRRRGKQLWFEMERPPHPLFHFGMTGSFRVPSAPDLMLASSRKRERDTEWPPRFRKIQFLFDDGSELAMTNKRRLGRIRLQDDPENEPPISALGFDPLLDLPTPRVFHELVARRSIPMKALLLDQSFAAGVGNWIADEVLYQASVDPRRRASSLSKEETARVRAKLRAIVKRAVDVDAESARFPKTWLFHVRWGKNEGTLTKRGERVEFLELAGRTTAWVPSVQG